MLASGTRVAEQRIPKSSGTRDSAMNLHSVAFLTLPVQGSAESLYAMAVQANGYTHHVE